MTQGSRGLASLSSQERRRPRQQPCPQPQHSTKSQTSVPASPAVAANLTCNWHSASCTTLRVSATASVGAAAAPVSGGHPASPPCTDDQQATQSARGLTLAAGKQAAGWERASNTPDVSVLCEGLPRQAEPVLSSTGRVTCAASWFFGRGGDLHAGRWVTTLALGPAGPACLLHADTPAALECLQAGRHSQVMCTAPPAMPSHAGHDPAVATWDGRAPS